MDGFTVGCVGGTGPTTRGHYVNPGSWDDHRVGTFARCYAVLLVTKL
jgi:hypothetical protein